jgi:hypothetical protein
VEPECTIIPVITGVTGIVTKSLRKNLEAIPGKYSIDSLQKAAILGTSHIIRKVLQCETGGLSGGGHRWFKRGTGKKRPVTRDKNSYNNNNNNPQNQSPLSEGSHVASTTRHIQRPISEVSAC